MKWSGRYLKPCDWIENNIEEPFTFYPVPAAFMTQCTVWEENKPAANRLHPTMKPVELIERALVNSSKAGDTVVDLFGGSGSTLIACERRGRVARLLELDPRYADVICRRYQECTGKAVLNSDGRTFEDVAAERFASCASQTGGLSDRFDLGMRKGSSFRRTDSRQ
jgi:DNA modification methylase